MATTLGCKNHYSDSCTTERERESAVTKEDVEGVLKKNARGGESLVARIVL